MPCYVITGASRNVGLAFAKHIAQDSSNIVIALNRSPAKEKVEGIHEIQADLTDLPSLQAAAKQIEQLSGGKVDVLILNGSTDPNEEFTLDPANVEEIGEKMTKAFQTNTIGNLQLAVLLLPLLRAGESKKIVGLTSPHNWLKTIKEMKLKGVLPFSASKGANDIIMARLSNQLGPEGFSVFSICPNFVLSRESIAERGMDPDELIQGFSSIPGFKGLTSYEDGARIMLNVINRATPEDGGKRFDMWGNEGSLI